MLGCLLFYVRVFTKKIIGNRFILNQRNNVVCISPVNNDMGIFILLNPLFCWIINVIKEIDGITMLGPVFS